MTTYEDYLEAVRTQEQRDRDRFMGHDSHDTEPMYDARNGAAEMSDAWEMMFEPLRQAFEDLARVATSIRFEAFGLLPAASPKERTCKPKQPRHTYPKPKREWWRQ